MGREPAVALAATANGERLPSPRHRSTRLSAWLSRAANRLLGAPDLGHIPGPRGLEFARLMRHFQRDSLRALEVTHERYGPIASYPWPINTVIIYDPEAVQRVLVENQRNYAKGAQIDEMKAVMGNGLVTNSERTSWARSRAVVNRVMSARAVRGFVPTFTKYADALIDQWSDALHGRDEANIDVWTEMRTVTFQIAATTLLGASLSEADGQAIDDAVRYTSGVIHDHMFQLAPTPYWVPTRRNREFHRHRNNLDRIVRTLIETSRACPPDEDSGSIVDRLVHGVDADSGKPLSDQVLRDEIVTLLIAGYETTAGTLAWFFATIAAHPDVQTALQEEIQDAGLDVDSATLRQTHPQTLAAILEAIRLYTVIAMSSRRALRSDVLSGYSIPPNTTVVIPTWVLHRNVEHWPDPLRFEPERFMGCPASQKAAYVPFSKGERGCVGQTFATVEVATIVVRVLASFSLSLADAVPEAVSHVSVTPRGGLTLGIRRRTHA